MIFVTVGSMFPFDRLVRAMDDWAERAPGTDVVAQIGDGGFTPSYMRWERRLDRLAFEETVSRAEVVVAHAGVGSVLTARLCGKPIVLLPRRRHLGEHTSDHQVETAASLRDRDGIFVADTEDQLAGVVRAARTARPAGALQSRSADPSFIARIRDFIDGGPKADPPR